jgi:uncharacterized protein
VTGDGHPAVTSYDDPSGPTAALLHATRTNSLAAGDRAPSSALPLVIGAKLARLRRIVGALRGALVAYSGGVDSTLLAYVVREQLGERALACTATSPSIDDEELAAAVALAGHLGIRHRVVRTQEVEREDYASNTVDRCYVCRLSVFGRLLAVAREEGLETLVYGANLDDGGDFRPGQRAAVELGARAPLAEAELTKADVRALARGFGLPNADKPAGPCLSSRIPYGQRVTLEKLRQIGAAERALRRLGFTDVRVRHHGTVARIEVSPGELERIAQPASRLAILRAFAPLGFAYVALDLLGFRSGSLNEVLAGAGNPDGKPSTDVPADF